MSVALAQIAHPGNARSGDPVLSPVCALNSPFGVGAVALSVGLQLLAISFEPLAHVLQLVELGSCDWAVVIAPAAIPAVIGQVVKGDRSGSRAQPLLGES